MKLPTSLLALLTLAAAPAVHAAAIFTQDTFDADRQGWDGNGGLAHVATGGPAGAGDGFLSMGNAGQIRLAAFNLASTHKGDFQSEGIVAVTVDMMAPATNSTSPEMRIVLFGPNTSNRWTSSESTTIPTDGVWREYTFSLAEADLTQARGTDSYANLITSVERIMVRHDPGGPSATGVFYNGQVNMDNFTLVPEPTTPLFLALASLLAVRRRR